MRAALIGAIALLALAAGCGGGSNESASTTGASGPVVKTIAVSETDFALAPKSIRLDRPGTYVFHATNDGNVTHALELEGNGIEAKTASISPGDSADLRVAVKSAGDYELYCPVGNHRAMGMEAAVAVGTAGAGGGATTDEMTSTRGSAGY